MRYNDFEHDPYSHGDPWNAICSRGDLTKTGYIIPFFVIPAFFFFLSFFCLGILVIFVIIVVIVVIVIRNNSDP